MILKTMTRSAICLSVLALLAATPVFAQTVQYQPQFNAIDTTDYSGVPADGWWFANFNTTTLETSQPVAQNAIDNLPSWMQLGNTFDPDPLTSTYSWDQELVLGTLQNASESTGGNPAFNTLTLPDSSTGLSGQAITTWEAGDTGQSRNIINSLVLGPGTPSAFRLWVVVDNEDADTGTGVRRVKARLSGPGVPDDTEDDTGNGIDDTRNNIADAYAFKYDGITDDMILRVQLRNTNSPIGGDAANVLGAGMAGIIVQVIPEPSSIVLILAAAMGLGLIRRR